MCNIKEKKKTTHSGLLVTRGRSGGWVTEGRKEQKKGERKKTRRKVGS